MVKVLQSCCRSTDSAQVIAKKTRSKVKITDPIENIVGNFRPPDEEDFRNVLFTIYKANFALLYTSKLKCYRKSLAMSIEISCFSYRKMFKK